MSKVVISHTSSFILRRGAAKKRTDAGWRAWVTFLARTALSGSQKCSTVCMNSSHAAWAVIGAIMFTNTPLSHSFELV